MMFQSYALFPHMTVEKNIAFGLKQDGMSKDEMAERVSQMLKMVKLEQFASRKPNQLSGGQRQRVALARSLAKRPKVLLLDEPLGALDKKLREETQFELMDLQQSLGLTFVVVTHDQEEAMTMADRIAVMSHGKVVQVATPAEIYEAPNSRFVADFIGDVNIFDGKVTAASNGAVEIAVESGFTVRTASAETPAAGAALGFAIRPEKIRVTRAAPANAAVNAARGELWDIAYLGDMTVFHVRLPSGKTVKASSLNAQRSVEDPFTYDQEVWVSFAEDGGVLLKD
jgi:putrescine transport system ATP-binding protein